LVADPIPLEKTMDATAEQGRTDRDQTLLDLNWLLDGFRTRVPGVQQVLLASRDGLKLSLTGASIEQADRLSAIISGLYSLGAGINQITDSGGGIRQVAIEHDAANLYIMSAGEDLPLGATLNAAGEPNMVGTVLGVLASPDADAGLIGYEMSTLIKSVAEHLSTPTRRPPARVDSN
jgi:predicted regulator of Ras-like GTPase activity (Roadblock/LC7/MglB family)